MTTIPSDLYDKLNRECWNVDIDADVKWAYQPVAERKQGAEVAEAANNSPCPDTGVKSYPGRLVMVCWS